MARELQEHLSLCVDIAWRRMFASVTVDFSSGGDLQGCDPLLLVLAHSWWTIFLYPLISATYCILHLLTPFELVVTVPWWIIETYWQVSSLPDDYHAGVSAALLLHLPFNQNAEYVNAKLAVWLLPSCSLQKWWMFAQGWPFGYCPVLAQ